MPEQEMHTTAFWLHFPAAFLAQFPDLTPTEKQNGISGLGNALRTVAALLLMCDPRDLGVVPEPQSPTTGLPTITVYEHTPGGVGYAEQLFVSLPEILAAAHDLVNACPCETGCPACVGPVLEHEYMLDTKMLARALLAEMCVA